MTTKTHTNKCEPQAHELERTHSREVVAMVWAAGQECDIEGAGDSNARVVVIEGEVVDEAFVRTDTGFRRVRRQIKAGEAVELPAGTVHRLACMGPAVTVHEFRPPRPQLRSSAATREARPAASR